DRQVERIVRGKDDARSEVEVGGERGLLAEDHPHVREAAAIAGERETTTRDARAVAAVARLGETEKDLLRGREVGRERNIEKSALAGRVHLGHTGDGR